MENEDGAQASDGGNGRRYRGRGPDLRRSERRQKLCTAGLELFGGGPGYAATPVKAVCERAGVSTRHYYEHFEDREALLRCLVEQLGVELMTASFAASSGNAELETAVRGGVRAYLEVLAADPRKARLLFQESVGIGDSVERARNEIRNGFAAFVSKQAVVLGAVGQGTRPHALLPIGIVGAVHEMAHQAFQQARPLDLDSLTDQCCLVYLAVAEHLARGADSSLLSA